MKASKGTERNVDRAKANPRMIRHYRGSVMRVAPNRFHLANVHKPCADGKEQEWAN